jgi:hypothetical protein
MAMLIELSKLKLRDPKKAISVAALALLILDTFIQPLSGVGLGLAVLAMAPWSIDILKQLDFLHTVELPGGVKLQFKEQLAAATEKAAEAGLLPENAQPAIERPTYEIIFDQDPVLALAGLRIEIEKRLRRLLLTKSTTSVGKTMSLSKVVSLLRENGLLNFEESSAIADLLPLLNSAMHSREFSHDAAAWAIGIGPKLIAALDAKLPGQIGNLAGS